MKNAVSPKKKPHITVYKFLHLLMVICAAFVHNTQSSLFNTFSSFKWKETSENLAKKGKPVNVLRAYKTPYAFWNSNYTLSFGEWCAIICHQY